MKHGKSILQVLGIYGAASWVVLQVVDVLKQNMGLPDWVFPFSLVLLLIGLPIILTTLLVQRKLSGAGGDALATEAPVTESVAEAVSAGRVFNWRNAILGGVLAFSLLFGFAGLAVLLKEKVLSPEEALAENAAPAIAVLPFSVRGEGLDVWREGMVDLLSTNLDGAAGMRSIAGRTVIARWNEEGADEGGGDLETSLAVARATGASYALLGTAISSGSGMRLTADIYDAKTGNTLGSVRVEGPADSVFALVDELSVAAVREMATGEAAGAESLELSGVSTRSIDALKAYLEGMSYFRRSNFAAAAESFKAAVAEDSTFALAYLRLGDTYGWMEGAWSGAQAEAHEKAVSFRDQLPYREQILMDAELSVTDRNLDGLEGLQRFVRDHPDDADGWFMLGELYLHRGGSLPIRRGEIENAFQRAVTLDPTFGPYHGHLIDLALWTTPDSAYVEGLIDEYRETTGGTTDRGFVAQLAFGDAETRSRAVASLDSVPMDDIVDLLFALRHPRYWEPFEAAMQAYYARAEAADVSGVSPERIRRASRFYSVTGAEQAGQARKAVEYLDDSAMGPGGECMAWRMSQVGLVLPEGELDNRLSVGGLSGDLADLGIWQLSCRAQYAIARSRSGDLERLIVAIRAIRSEAEADEDTTNVAYIDAQSDVIEGFRLWKSGDPAAALPLIERNQRDVGGVLPRWWIASINLELGRTEEALPWLESFWGSDYVTMAYYELGKAYEELGRLEDAVAAYAEFVEAWTDADPELQPVVADARTRLEEIVRERG
jgi:tetratricopeptide (TPR) repeat protein